MRWVAPLSEVWVTEPGRKQIEFFALDKGALVHKGALDDPRLDLKITDGFEFLREFRRHELGEERRIDGRDQRVHAPDEEGAVGVSHPNAQLDCGTSF